MSIYLVILLGAAAFFTSIISAVVGMAGGIVLLSIMTLFLSLDVIVPVHGVVQLVSNSTRSLSLRKKIEPRIVLPSLVGIPIGTLIATQVIKSVDNKEVFYFLIAGVIFYVLFKPKQLPALKIPYWSFGLLGVAVGFLNPLVGATGPFMAPFYLRDDLSKERIVATKATVQAYGHLLKVPAFLYLGFDYVSYWLITMVMVVGVILGTRYGVTLLAKISEHKFRFIFRVTLFLAACRVCYKAIVSLM